MTKRKGNGYTGPRDSREKLLGVRARDDLKLRERRLEAASWCARCDMGCDPERCSCTCHGI